MDKQDSLLGTFIKREQESRRAQEQTDGLVGWEVNRRESRRRRERPRADRWTGRLGNE